MTAENPFAKFPKLTGSAFCAMAIGSRGEPKTVWSAQCLNPCERRAPPANAASTTTVAIQRRISDATAFHGYLSLIHFAIVVSLGALRWRYRDYGI